MNAYTIKYQGGPRAGTTSTLANTPRAIPVTIAEQVGANSVGHYYRKDVDADLKTAAYQWKED